MEGRYGKRCRPTKALAPLYKLLFAIACGTCSTLFVTSSAVAQTEGTLTFLESSLPLTLGPPGDEKCDWDTGRIKDKSPDGTDVGTAKGTVHVRYSGGERALHNLQFEPDVETKKIAVATLLFPGKPMLTDTSSVTAHACSRTATIERSDVHKFTVLVVVTDPSELASAHSSTSSGYLFVRANGKAEPGALELELNNYEPLSKSTLFWIVVSSLAYLILVLIYFVNKYRSDLGRSLAKRFAFVSTDPKEGPGPAFKLTVTGAILGSLTALGIVPEDPFFLPSKADYAILAGVFAGVFAGSGLLHNFLAARKQERSKSSTGYSYLLASAGQLGAGFGQLITVLLVLTEVGIQDPGRSFLVRLIQYSVVIVAVVATRAAFRQVGRTLEESPTEAPEPGALMESTSVL